jgi:hypothetical protein
MQCALCAHNTVRQAREAGKVHRSSVRPKTVLPCVCGTATRENTVLLALPRGESAFLQDIPSSLI